MKFEGSCHNFWKDLPQCNDEFFTQDSILIDKQGFIWLPYQHYEEGIVNPYINIIVSNADKKTYGYELSNFISCKPPIIEPVNENGAGDVMTGTYIYYKSKFSKNSNSIQ